MVDFVGYAVIGFLGVFSGVFTTTYILWRLKKDSFFEEIVENIINDVSTDPELQKNLYSIGGLVGQGAKVGMGLTATRGGKFKLEDILLQLVGNWAQGVVPGMANTSPTPGPPPLPRNPLKDRFFNP